MNNKRSFNFKRINKKFIFAVLVLLGFFFFTQIYVMSQVGTKSAEIERIRIQKDEIRRENEILTSNIDKEKSVASFQDVISTLGLQEKQVKELEAKINEQLAMLN